MLGFTGELCLKKELGSRLGRSCSAFKTLALVLVIDLQQSRPFCLFNVGNIAAGLELPRRRMRCFTHLCRPGSLSLPSRVLQDIGKAIQNAEEDITSEEAKIQRGATSVSLRKSEIYWRIRPWRSCAHVHFGRPAKMTESQTGVERDNSG